MNIVLHRRRLQSDIYDQKLIKTLFTEVINQVRRWVIFSKILNTSSFLFRGPLLVIRKNAYYYYTSHQTEKLFSQKSRCDTQVCRGVGTFI